jgi:hypothetical protein
LQSVAGGPRDTASGERGGVTSDLGATLPAPDAPRPGALDPLARAPFADARSPDAPVAVAPPVAPPPAPPPPAAPLPGPPGQVAPPPEPRPGVAAPPPDLPHTSPVEAARPSPPRARSSPPAPRSVATAADARGPGALAIVLALAAGALAASFVLRPLRRWFVLRHLRRPWWRESVAQRVSNLWQLALVGLRDAGWRAIPGEGPSDLARRVGVEGVRDCADVLDRARHGAAVDAEDLATMERAAATAFATARDRAGRLVRIASWWRAPVG